MPLFMIHNDITKMQVDAIVNPSNPELHMGRGTSWAIYNAAGETELTNACRKIDITVPYRLQQNMVFNLLPFLCCHQDFMDGPKRRHFIWRRL